MKNMHEILNELEETFDSLYENNLDEPLEVFWDRFERNLRFALIDAKEDLISLAEHKYKKEMLI